MKLCIAGKNNIAVNILIEALKLLDKEDVLIVLNRNDLGENKNQKSLKFFAEKHDLSIVKLEQLYDVDDLVFLSLEFDSIVNTSMFKSTNLYNVHFSLLPSYKGVYTSYWPIVNNEERVGVTLHEIDQGIDAGDIIDQDSFELPRTFTSRMLYDKYIDMGIKLVISNLDNLLFQKPLLKRKQSPLGSSYYSRKSVNFKNIAIDLRQTAEYIHNQIRALNFREFQLAVINNISVSHSMILTSRSLEKPGKVLFDDEHCMIISTIDYDLKLFKDKLVDLVKASRDGDITLISNLARLGYDLNERNSNGWTPLITASYHGQSEVVKFLLENGAQPDLNDWNGTTPLMYAQLFAKKSMDTRIFDLLLDFGANPWVTDFEGLNLHDHIVKITNSDLAIKLINKVENVKK